jgi:heat-inducible transcriptional repressor
MCVFAPLLVGARAARVLALMPSHKLPSGMNPAVASALDERARRVLSAIVRDYIQGGEPVGSHAIARRPDVDVSSATVRAVMADLEDLGFLEKPHTSAGRIPTSRGYRYFVDVLLRMKQPLPEEREQIERHAHENASHVEGMMAAASRVLHSLTKHAGVVASPRPQAERLSRVEFLQLREGRVLAILVSRSGAVRNRVLNLSRPLSASELTQAANYLNSLVTDLTLSEALLRVKAEQARDLLELGALKAHALSLGAQVVQVEGAQVRIEGQASLLDDKAIAQDVVKIRALVVALEGKDQLLQVLDRTLDAQELQIFIGAESGIIEPDLAIVAAPYRLNGEVVGALGVIGPTRMDYSRVAPLVELTARIVGQALDEG